MKLKRLRKWTAILALFALLVMPFHSQSVHAEDTRINQVVAIAAGDTHFIAIKVDGTVWTWGINNNRALAKQVSGLTNIVAVSGGNGYSLALKNDGTVWQWHRAGSGSDDVAVRQVSTLNDVVAISAGMHFQMALKGDGTVWTWGDNGDGQLGSGTVGGERTVPEMVKGLSQIKKISAGGSHAMALQQDGTLWSWGANYRGELGHSGWKDNEQIEGNELNEQSATPFPIPTDKFRDVAAGYGFTVGMTDQSVLKSWGNNSMSELGQGGGGDNLIHMRPELVYETVGITKLFGGKVNTAALLLDGQAEAWGNNFHGSLGNRDNPAAPNWSVPLLMNRYNGVWSANPISIALGHGQTAVLLDNGQVYCWGYDENGTGTYVTVDLVAPSVGNTIPADGAENVALPDDHSLNVTIEMGEPFSIAPGGLDQITVTDQLGQAIPFTPKYSEGSTQLELTLYGLEFNTRYRVFIPAGIILDAGGNPLDNGTTLSFSTMANPFKPTNIPTQADIEKAMEQNQSPIQLTDSDIDHVYFDGNTVSFKIPAFLTINETQMMTTAAVGGPPDHIPTGPQLPTSVRIAVGVYDQNRNLKEDTPIFTNMQYDATNHYYYVNATLTQSNPSDIINAYYTVSGVIQNPGNSTLPTGALGVKIYPANGGTPYIQQAIPPQDDLGRLSFVGVQIPDDQVTAEPGLETITNLYNAPKLKFMKQGLGAIEFDAGLNIMDDHEQLDKLEQTDLLQITKSDTSVDVGVATDSLSFLGKHGATITLYNASKQFGDAGVDKTQMENLLDVGVTTNHGNLVPPEQLDRYFDRSQLVYDAASDTISLPVKHFTTYHFKLNQRPQGDFKVWSDKQGVAKDKVWKVNFNKELQAGTVNNNTVRVTNASGKTVPILVNLENDNNTITVKPFTDYTSGQSYYLYLTRDITSATGKHLSKTVEMKFGVQ